MKRKEEERDEELLKQARVEMVREYGGENKDQHFYDKVSQSYI